MLKTLFPYEMYLHIFQLEEYQVGRFLKWVYLNFTKRKVGSKKQLVWTFKVRFILWSAMFYVVALNFLLVCLLNYLGLFIGILLATQSYLFLILGLLTLKPYEILNRKRVKGRTRAKILSLKQRGLKVVGIAGSYGKTSVKEFLYQILKTKYKVLRTPESYNTLFGIWKTVDYELDNHYDFFICEMGAYKIGEIKELCEMVLPDHAILTGINEQHIDRFKKIENTIKAKFEIIDYSDKEGIALLNGNNEHIKDNYAKHRGGCVLYALPTSRYNIKNIRPDKTGSRFTLGLDGNTFEASTGLIGNSNLENILAAASMAYLLRLEPQLIIEAIGRLKPIPHRQELKTWLNGLTVIDDAYSSNATGFKSALDLLESFHDYHKVIATPGIVELGEKTQAIHRELGGLIDSVCDEILLIGKNERTLSIKEGIVNKNKVTFINALNELSEHITNIDNTIALIENDLPDNY